jgi:hypothetical protein
MTVAATCSRVNPGDTATGRDSRFRNQEVDVHKLFLAVVTIALVLPGLLASAQKYNRAYQYCERLRIACERRDQLGEQGEGNCHRYREACKNPQQTPTYRDQYCARLRAACSNKDWRGEDEDEGNCTRYRRECRGR